MKARTLVTAALPYANGRLHIGHVAGAYLPADEYVRYLRLAGREAVFLCGSDENGAPITYSAMKEGTTPTAIIDRYHKYLDEGLAGLGIRFDFYGRTHCPRHDEVTQAFFLKLLERGHIARETSEQVYCRTCGMFLPDRYVEGVCPYPDCGAPGARGDQCEKCGRPVDATKLREPACMVCRMRGVADAGAIEVRPTEHWYLQLQHFQDELRAYLDRHPEWRETVKTFSYGLLDQGLRERAITRDMDWGVPVPLPEGKGKVLYVWFDAPLGYLTFTRQYFEARGEPDRWKEYWQDARQGLVHFIGKDNTVFHAVIFPGMLLGHGDYRLPDTVVSNEFLNLEKEKISTSRDYAVWVDEYLQAFSPEPLRYYLTAIAPESADADFTWKDFQARNNGELADNLGNFIQRNLGFCQKYFDAKVPDAPLTADGELLMKEIEEARAEMGALLAGFKFKAALERLMRLSQRGNRFFAEEAPWKTRTSDPARCASTIAAGMRLVEALGVLMAPFLPASAERLRGFLGLPPLAAGDWEAASRLMGGQALPAPEVLFPKIDDAAIEAQAERLRR